MTPWVHGRGEDMTQAIKQKAWVRQVLSFWFDELDRSDWFRANSSVDDAISTRFGGLVDELGETPASAHLDSAKQALAAVISLDQFPRNIFRGTERAFQHDALALEISKASVTGDLDEPLNRDQRLFLYLPLEHSESLEDQDLAVRLISTLNDDVYTQYARAHRDVIERFGRFPHRNGILGRTSTPEEVAFLAEPNSGF